MRKIDKVFASLRDWFMTDLRNLDPGDMPTVIVQFANQRQEYDMMTALTLSDPTKSDPPPPIGTWFGIPYEFTYFKRDEWHRIREIPPPTNEMFIWARRNDRGGWSIGLAYPNVSGSTSDAHNDHEGLRHATHWKIVGKPPR